MNLPYSIRTGSTNIEDRNIERTKLTLNVLNLFKFTFVYLYIKSLDRL